MTLKPITSLLLFLLISQLSCQSKKSDDFDKDPPFYYKMPKNLTSEDVSPSWNKDGQNLLLTGIVYKSDGITPAENVLLYYYQTNKDGKYISKPDEKRNMPPNKLGQTHGYIRGWVKTNKDGKYSIYTTVPGSYPSRNEPAHIHLNIKEPNLKHHYYVDDFVFDDDVLLTTKKRTNMQNRGGNGVLRLVEKKGLFIGERNIYLGLNIPYQNQESTTKIESGRNVGEDVLSFTPYHAWGPDKGTKTCPICKYGWYQGILYFVGNNPNWPEIKNWLNFLDLESVDREIYLKVYFIYGNESDYDIDSRISFLENFGKKLNLKKTALTFVPSFSDNVSQVYLNELNQNVENTFLIYKRTKIIEKYINLKFTTENMNKIRSKLDLSVNDYFDLPRAKN